MNLINSETGTSEVIGHAIILSITVVGMALIMMFGFPAISGMQGMVNVRNVEQVFTMLDSRASQAILGDSPMQIVEINLGGGILSVEPDGPGKESYMVIKSKNDTFNITMPMGKVTYYLGERIIAYEGGGIWSKYPSGGSVMLSPPELNYNGVTLSLPAINIKGNGSSGGEGTAIVSFKKGTMKLIFPNSSMPNRTNPLNYSQSGKVYVNITSDFYDAWADFAKSLTYTMVEVNPQTRTAYIELTVVPNTMGGNTSITQPITIRGLPNNGEPLEKFSFKIRPSSNNIKWDIRAISGNKKLIFSFKDPTIWAPGNVVDLTIGYKEGNNDGETWGAANFTIQPDGYAYVDLLSPTLNLTYQFENVGADNANQCQPFGRKIQGIVEPDYSWDGIIINTTTNNIQPLHNITQHYMGEVAEEGDITFFNCSPSNQGNQAPDSTSTMLINYNAVGALTYLHISENDAEIEIT